MDIYCFADFVVTVAKDTKISMDTIRDEMATSPQAPEIGADPFHIRFGTSMELDIVCNTVTQSMELLCIGSPEYMLIYK